MDQRFLAGEIQVRGMSITVGMRIFSIVGD